MNPQKKRAEKYLDRRKKDKNSFRRGNPPLACGKSCYPSKSEAKASIRRVMGAGTLTEKELMNHYWCVKCQSWHIGHRKPIEGRSDVGIA